MPPLPRSEIDARLRNLPGWTTDGQAIAKTLTFPSFADAIAFVTRLAFDAEAVDHHPDLQVSYRTVTVRWSTHSEGGVTEQDLAGATNTDALAARWRG